MKYALSSFLWPVPASEQLEQWLQKVKSIDFDGFTGVAELGLQDYFSNPEPFRDAVARAGLMLTSLSMTATLDFERYRHAAHFMQEVGCPHLIVMGGVGSTSADRQALGGFLNYVGEIALEAGARLSYHHHHGTCGASFEDIEEILKYTDPQKVGLVLDTGQACKRFDSLPVAARSVRPLRQFWERIHLIELSDWSEKHDLNTPIGEGDVNWQVLFEVLANKAYDDWLVIEQNCARHGYGNLTPLIAAQQNLEVVKVSQRIEV